MAPSLQIAALIIAISIVVAQRWPSVCPQDGTNSTRCPATQTCMSTEFSVTGAGCCPWPNAVACTAGTTQCCPAGTTCKLVSGSDYSAVFNCTDSTTGAFVTENAAVCKPGALLPFSSTLKNVLVVGDSLSMGYISYLGAFPCRIHDFNRPHTPYLYAAAALDGVAIVQHAPADVSDGGAEETAYGMRCLDNWLHYADGSPLQESNGTTLDLITL